MQQNNKINGNSNDLFGDNLELIENKEEDQLEQQ